MPNDDSRDPSPTRQTNRKDWLLGGLYVVIIAAVLVYTFGSFDFAGWFDRAPKLDPAPEVLGRAPWDGEVTSDFNQAVPILECAIYEANRIVLTVREGLLWHETKEPSQRETGRKVYYLPCRVYELWDRSLRKVDAGGFIHSMRYYRAAGFDHSDETNYDLIFHFYKEDKLLAVLGWINGADIIRGWNGKPPLNYLRWFDGGWQGDVELSGDGAYYLFAWLTNYGIYKVSEGKWLE